MNTIRIYNPIKQALEKDQDGRFIRYWIPEIAHLDIKILADPKLHPQDLDYPKPIIDIESANRQARETLWGIKRKKQTRQLSEKIFEKHGSRVFRSKKKSVLQITLFD
jgi:deoxyribodipyrimidine photo-lyase